MTEKERQQNFRLKNVQVKKIDPKRSRKPSILISHSNSQKKISTDDQKNLNLLLFLDESENKLTTLLKNLLVHVKSDIRLIEQFGKGADGIDAIGTERFSPSSITITIGDMEVRFDISYTYRPGEADTSSSIFSEVEKQLASRTEPFLHEFLKLSKKEVDIIGRLSMGSTDKEIGNDLCLSHRTIGNIRQNLLNKLGVRNTTELVSKSIRAGLIH